MELNPSGLTERGGLRIRMWMLVPVFNCGVEAGVWFFDKGRGFVYRGKFLIAGGPMKRSPGKIVEILLD